jgi:hypothetical protein
MNGVSGQFECILRDRDGRAIEAFILPNAAVYEGLNAALDGVFSGGALASPWYIGLIAGGAAPTLSANDTMASHPGWTELTGYDEADRQGWITGSASGGSKTSSAPAVFTITADTSTRGMFLCGDNAKGGATGPLWATAAGSNRTLLAGQTLEVSYTNRITPIS